MKEGGASGGATLIFLPANDRSDHLHLSADAPLAVDHLPALLGPHPGAESDLPGSLNLAGLVGVVHERDSFCLRFRAEDSPL
jgi:hypothetical protein